MSLAKGEVKEYYSEHKRKKERMMENSDGLVKIRWISDPLRLAFHRGMWYYKVIFYGG